MAKATTGIRARAKAHGHGVKLAGKGKSKLGGTYSTYQCPKCWALATKEKGKEFGPLITQKCPGLQSYAKGYKRAPAKKRC